MTYPNHSSEDLAEIMARLHEDEECCERMARSSKKTYAKYFNADDVYRDYCDFIEELVKTK